ncbi:(deoxy)nucleoside triphosphate pyrophosphohydrolase [Dehalobacter sp. DCM]|uniref:(deoxy)nucleoside triphosphate pyrophosphohydrolase n=1 Tax=Dehalobacter sp. DCM TaxID=2907827 RepID=UPI0030813983|nr:(deoxy)nucleoside triphosphate pyrophosphohydrolase [Dehalobacter sp. DCM]
MSENSDVKKITAVTAAIIRKGDDILICQRAEGGSCSLLWEFPGGKQEVGETLKACLIRECLEELGVVIHVEDIYSQVNYTYGEKEMAFTFFHAHIISGQLKKRVHQDIRWVKRDELKAYEFCPADVEVARGLGSE